MAKYIDKPVEKIEKYLNSHNEIFVSNVGTNGDTAQVDVANIMSEVLKNEWAKKKDSKGESPSKTEKESKKKKKEKADNDEEEEKPKKKK